MDFPASKYLYLGLILCSLVLLLVQSILHRNQLAKNGRLLLPGVILMMVIFISWDIWFTNQNVWWFNSNYLSGLYISNLPIEEYLFLITIPIILIFVHETQLQFIKKDPLERFQWMITFIVGVVLLLFAVLFYQRIYTFIVFFCAGVLLLIIQYFNPSWLSRFWLTYFITTLPFIIIESILTGSYIAEPVINYSDKAITGFRILTVPIENLIYCLFMSIIVIGIYSRMKSSASK